ncbi:Hypothetical_protein [Hexamita inflata]|uniref:Hypothetical_protein n=1 Tax=Hexamita inflata TaxID=28002 RepID=A0AA86QSL2_9EUKA|nr:Hypothetical protein HINF_LOCUS52911 [Hexamita inflata]
MSKKNQYCCVLTWFCILFISMFAAGITLACIPNEVSYPIYSEWNNQLQYSMSYNYIYQNVGVGVTLSLVGFFGFIITCCFSCVLKKQNSSETQPLIQTPQFVHPQVNYPQMNHQPQMNYQSPQMNVVPVQFQTAPIQNMM